MSAENNTIINFLSIEEYADNLYCVSESISDKRLRYYQLQAKEVGADYFYCLDSELEKHKIPFVYIFDYRNKQVKGNELAIINKKIWTVGEIAIAIVIDNNEITVIDTRLPIQVTKKGELKPNILHLISKIDFQLKEQIFAGRILEDKTNDYLSVSPYVKLLEHIDKNILSKESLIGCSSDTLRPLVVKCILIKYLEEQVDEKEENIFKNNFFAPYLKKGTKTNTTFCDILRNGDIPKLFKQLGKKFNGGVFDLTAKEIAEIYQSDLSTIATALDGHYESYGQGSFWQLYDLKFIPIEFISRLYERFILTVDGRQQKDGAYYTPPHLARLLIDELLPFDREIDFDNFKLLDPSCGSGIFLVLAYKRLITLWMLQNNKDKIEGKDDISTLKKVLSNCIYGLDINRDAISITATSLQIEYTSNFHPKDIDLIQFDNLMEKGNLGVTGFFKWYKNSEFKFDVIVGNPPFNIDKEENKNNAKKGLDDICDNEFYFDKKNRKQDFPDKNPALTILYKSLEKLLAPSGLLFMIMPSSAFLYNPTSLSYRRTIFSNWNTHKIYDFTSLKDFLWGKTKVATIAILIENVKSNFEPIKHIIVRSSYLNHKGALRFQIDKYDQFLVPFEKASKEKCYWKTNLLGGGRLHFYVGKYLSNPYSVEDYRKDKNWIANVGFQRDASAKKNKINLLGRKIILSENIQDDSITDKIYKICNKDDVVRVNSKRELYDSPNILIRLNLNYNIPILLNNENAFFPKGMLGIKGGEQVEMEEFITTFKLNKPIYKQLVGVASSKIFIQQSGRYTIDAQDIMNLPLKVDSQGNPVPFDEPSDMEKAVWEDTELLAQCINKTEGVLFDESSVNNLEEYASAFCEIMNFIYENGDYKFRLKRMIINEYWVWVTFFHANSENPIELNISEENENIYRGLLKDDISNNGLRINRIVTYINEPNCISFLKPRALKYWTRSIGYRDAEEIKGIMFNKGF
ncbi:MAG: N-6 DNA methylase [Bacteroidales bacterium]|nr:N-6 DNA methylase [Bacteroidales bacterium]